MNTSRSHLSGPQRSFTTNSYGVLGPQHHQAQQPPGVRPSVARPGMPSRLSSGRSVSYNSVVDLTAADNVNATGYAGNAVTSASLARRMSVPGTQEIIDLEDNVEQRPAKRMRTSDDGSQNSEEGTVSSPMAVDAVDDAVNRVLPGSPLPAPPNPVPATVKLGSGKTHGRRLDSAARKANGTDPPSMAVQLPPPKKVADFSPWTGQHPEDTMNETVVKAGYFDKGPGASQSESNSALSTIWPSLSQKNNIGLQTLSHLFVQVMEKRQAMGKCTAPSTFKPPPRVTVTDTKREAWLRDLANPEVPLRKQSRTIPHGIRGRLLMEQCLSKDIPLQRAVWLAKCVGANELRAFRRKGVSGASAASGESKWMREWTVQVEQFLESVITGCGQVDGWKFKMEYALKLVTHFFGERLLECGHYLDWIVTSLADATIDRLPIWIVLTQMYWNAITAYGRRGRKLALVVLKHLQTARESPKAPLYSTLTTRLERLLTVMALSKRACLLIPRSWAEYRDTIMGEYPVAASVPTAQAALASIARRNERLASSFGSAGEALRSPVLSVIDLLDSTGLRVNPAAVSQQCAKLIPDVPRRVFTILEWASSIYRLGTARVYLAAKVIEHIQVAGADVDSAVLSFLQTHEGSSTIQQDTLNAIIAELVRLQVFSVGRFLQWIITSGVLYSGFAGLAAGVLVALPKDKLPVHIRNTRQTLLNRMGRTPNTDLPFEALTSLQVLFGMSPSNATVPKPIPSVLTSSDKDAVRSMVEDKVQSITKYGTVDVSTWFYLRDVVEKTEDFTLLAELLHASMSTDIAAILALVTDTISNHAETFAVLDKLQPLSDGILERYRALRTQQPLDRTWILSLSSLSKRLPDKAAVVMLLSDDLVYCEQQNAMMVCSPASDNMTGMQASSLDTADDIDAVFASGNTMDEHLMKRVFDRIMSAANKALPMATCATSKLGAWLNQLRSLDAQGFDQLTHESIRAFASVRAHAHGATSKQGSTYGVAALVTCSCTTFDAVVEALWTVNTPQTAITALQLLTVSTNNYVALHPVEQYRLAVMQKRYIEDNIDSIAALARRGCAEPNYPTADPKLVKLAAYVAIRRGKQSLSGLEAKDCSQVLISNVLATYRSILYPNQETTISGQTLDPHSIIESADALSMPFCRPVLRLTSRTVGSSSSNGAESLRSALIQAILDDKEAWPQLVESIDAVHLRSIHQWACEQFFASFDEDNGSQDERSEKMLKAVRATKAAADTESETHMLGVLNDRFRVFERQLNDPVSAGMAEQGARKRLLHNLQMCLQVAALYADTGPDDETILQKRACLLAALCALLMNPRLQPRQDMIEHIFDVASMLSDSLPNELVAMLARAAPNPAIAADPRMVSILCTATSPDAWLALAFRPQPTGSQQQRLLNRQPSQQQVAGGRPGQAQQPHSQNPGPAQQQQQQQQKSPALTHAHLRALSEVKTVPYMLRRWETMPDPTPVMGENDTSISLGLFAARKV